MPDAAPIDPRVDIGHVHLKVADLDRALGFYCGVLGFELQQRIGDEAAFVSAGGYHHHIGPRSGREPLAAGRSRWSPNRWTCARCSPSWTAESAAFI